MTQNSDLAIRYREIYFKLFKKANPILQSRLLEAKTDPTIRDWEIDEFIKSVIQLAESDVSLESIGEEKKVEPKRRKKVDKNAKLS